MRRSSARLAALRTWPLVAVAILGIATVGLVAQAQNKKPTSYAPVALTEPFEDVMARMSAAKPDIMKRQMMLLEERYDMSDRPAAGVTMTKGKAVQEGVRVKLPAGVTWDQLANMTPEEIKQKGLWPKGFLPLPHPNHPEGGMVFPKYHIDEIKKQTAVDLTRFDLDYDLPDHFLPEYPPPIFLTTRPDLGDVSQGKVVTIRQLLRVVQRHSESQAARGAAPARDMPTPQQQFNHDRGSPLGPSESRRDLLRLPRQRPHKRHDASGRRHSAAGIQARAGHAARSGA